MHTSRSRVSRLATTPEASASTSNPTYVHPAESGVTSRKVPSAAGTAAGCTTRSLSGMGGLHELSLSGCVVLVALARRAHGVLRGGLGHRHVPPAVVAGDAGIAVGLDEHHGRPSGGGGVGQRRAQVGDR